MTNSNGKETGGSAFPHENHLSHRGMTLRDYFAAQAMTGCLPWNALGMSELKIKAQCAYRMADAMLEARK